MPRQDQPCRYAQGERGLDVLGVLDRQDLAAHQAREDRHQHDRDGQHPVDHPQAQHGGDGQGQHQGGQGHDAVEQAHQRLVHGRAQIARDQPQRHAGCLERPHAAVRRHHHGLDPFPGVAVCAAYRFQDVAGPQTPRRLLFAARQVPHRECLALQDQ